MKIMHLLQSDMFSGAENVVCQIIESFSNNPNFEFYYCSPNGQIKDALSQKKINFLPLKKFNIFEVKQIIKKEKPDIIHAHDMRATFYASFFCKDIQLISHIHNNNFNSRLLSVKSLCYYFAAKKSKHIFWVSESSYEGYKFHKKFEDKSSILYNIVNPINVKNQIKKDSNNYNYDVVYLGRLTYPKNPIRLINVLEIIIKRRPNTKVAIIGTGDMDEKVKNYVAKKGINNIDFLGFCNNPYKILNDSKVMIMTSLWEGTPMCALEAQVLGKPIVSTPVDGLKFLIKNNKTGYLSNDNTDLAENVIKLLDNDKLRLEMQANILRESATRNNINEYMEQIKSVYNLCKGIK